MEVINTCPVCDNKNFELYLKAKDFTVTNEEFELIKCTHCQFLITSPRPSAESIGKYYASENYISHSGKSKTLFDKIYLSARKVTMKWKFELITAYISQPGSLLDYGCGTGEFLHYIKSKEFNVIGVEPNEIAREKANIKLEGKVYKDLLDIKKDSIDLITLWHVLEHVHDLNETIQKLRNLLTVNGSIIIAVPNHKSHDAEKYKNAWAGYDVPRHLWHFTQQTMNSILEKNGLKIVSIHPMKLDSYYVSLLSEGYKNPDQPKMLTSFKALIEGIISNLSAKKFKEYSSLIYIAKQA